MSADPERILDVLSRMKDYCERIAFHMHRFGGREEFLRDWAYQDACIMILAQIGEEAKRIEPWLIGISDYDWGGALSGSEISLITITRTPTIQLYGGS